MAPGATSVTPSVELFGSRTRPAFDELGAARTLAQMIVDGVLQRDRAARLAQFAAHGSGLSLGNMIDALVGGTWRAQAPANAKLAALQRVAQRSVADRLLLLAADSDASPEVRSMGELKIVRRDHPERAVLDQVANDVGDRDMALGRVGALQDFVVWFRAADDRRRRAG